MKNVFIVFILISFLFSCSSPQRHSKKGEAMVEIDANRDNEVSIFDLCSKVEIIPLETNPHSLLTFPIGEPDRVIMNEGKFYFLDVKQEAVIIFDEDGNFQQKIDKRGDGPGEYLSLSDFTINRFTGNLELLSALGRYINVYDSSGETFLERIKLPDEVPVVHYFHHVTPDIYVCYSSAKGERLYFFSKKESDIVKGEDYSLPEWFNRTVFSPSKNPFYLYKDSLFFQQMYNGDVYAVSSTDCRLAPRYIWDLGAYTFDWHDIPENQTMKYYLDFSKKISMKYAVLFQIHCENSMYYFTRFKFKNRFKHLVLNKETNEYLLFDQFKEGFHCLPLAIDERAMYAFISPAFLDFVVKPSVLDEANRRKYEQIKEDDNPVIIKYIFK